MPFVFFGSKEPTKTERIGNHFSHLMAMAKPALLFGGVFLYNSPVIQVFLGSNGKCVCSFLTLNSSRVAMVDDPLTLGDTLKELPDSVLNDIERSLAGIIGQLS